jgi:transcriptional regulator with XRE-family HTH domain
MAMQIGASLRDARRLRRWTLRDLGARSGLTAAAVQRLESGQQGSLISYARVGTALGLRPELDVVEERRGRPMRFEDPVHSWLGDVETHRYQGFHLPVNLDEPYQHFQFAGRAHVVSWSLPDRALIHLENRTRFPNLQEALGSYNAKRAYLADAVARRVGLRGGFASVTHVMVGLWSAEVQHVLRLRRATFMATCPDDSNAFAAWWDGRPPRSGITSAFVLLDPVERPRARRWVGLEDALRVEARHRDYAAAVAAMQAPHIQRPIDVGGPMPARAPSRDPRLD